MIHDDFKITSVLVNGVDRSDFQSGVLILETEDPTVLNEFCQRYNAEIISQRDHRYLMKLDLAYSPINRLPELISLYNQAIEVNIEQASFASLEGMKTFAILLDAITHNVNWYPFSAELNSILEPHQAQNPLQDWDYNRAQVGFSWWLIDSKIQQLNGEKAWDYSLGTGVKTAVFDRGFAQSHPEINRRWLVGNKDGTEYHNNDGNLWKSNEGHTPDHGHKSVMTLAAEKDNKIKTAGSAPNAKVAPYFTWDAWAMENAVYKAASAGVKVVNISIAEEDFTWVTYSALAIPGFGSLIFDQLWHIKGNGLMQAIRLATQAGVTFVVSAGNGVEKNTKGVHYDGYIPSKHPDVIRVGAVMPGTLGEKNVPVRGLANSWPVPGQEALRVVNYSNFGNQMVWGPGDYVDVSDWKQHSQTSKYLGTSAASPFVAGVVALMISRNPSLTPSCIRQILLDTSASNGISVSKPENSPNYPSNLSPKFINALEAVKMAARRNGTTCQNTSATPKMVQTFGGIVTESGGQKKLLTWKSLLSGATASDKEKTLVQSVSNEVWAQLKKDEVVMIKGWTDIAAGESPISAQQLEIAEVTPLCAVSKCLSNAPVKPVITAVSTSTAASATNEFTLTLKGELLLPDIRSTEGRKFRVEFHPVGGGSPVILSYNLQPDSAGQNIWNVSKVTDIDHAANEVSVNIPAGSVPAGNYNLVFDSPLIGKSALFTGSAGGFQVSATGSGSGAIFIETNLPEQDTLPPNHYVYDNVGNRWLRPGFQTQVDANEFAGIRFNQPIRNLEVKIGPVLVPIVSILEDLAVVGIPESLPVGVHDVIVKASGQTLTLEQAVNKVSQAVQPTPEPSAPPSITPRRHRGVVIDNFEGQDEGRVYLNNRLILTGHAGAPAEYILSESDWDRQKPNEIRFELTNQGGGYSYSFGLYDDNGQIVYLDERGQAGVKNVMRNGKEDTTQGLVYQERMSLHEHRTPVGAGPYWVKMFNLRPDAELNVHISSNELNDIQWETGVFKMKGHYDETAKALPFYTIDNQEKPAFYYESWLQNQVFFSEFGPSLSQPIGIELYKGIHLIYRQIKGQAREPQSAEVLSPPALEQPIDLLFYPYYMPYGIMSLP